MCEEIQESPKPWHKKAHKHAKLIKQWADGAQIQVYTKSRGWLDCIPLWGEHGIYRVKPEKVFINYRVALMKGLSGYYCTTNYNVPAAEYLENYSTEFVRWLTDWIKVEC